MQWPVSLRLCVQTPAHLCKELPFQKTDVWRQTYKQTVFLQSAVDAVQWASHGTGDQELRRSKQSVSHEPHPSGTHHRRKPSLSSYDWNLATLDWESRCSRKCVPGRGHRKCSGLVAWGSLICFEDVNRWEGEVNAWEVSPLSHFGERQAGP